MIPVLVTLAMVVFGGAILISREALLLTVLILCLIPLVRVVKSVVRFRSC